MVCIMPLCNGSWVVNGNVITRYLAQIYESYEADKVLFDMTISSINDPTEGTLRYYEALGSKQAWS